MISKVSMDESRPVFVLNIRAIGLGVSRSLAMKGVPVIAIDYQEGSERLISNSFTEFHKIPDIEKSPDAAMDALIRCQEDREQRGILLPTSDAFILFASRNRERLSKYFDFVLPSEQVLELIMDKKSQYTKAAELGVPIPETHFPTSMDDLDGFKKDISYPSLIKPCVSYREDQPIDSVIEGVPFKVSLTLKVDSRIELGNVAVTFLDRSGRNVLTTMNGDSLEMKSLDRGIHKFTVYVNPNPFIRGSFNLKLSCRGPSFEEYDTIDYAFNVTVVPNLESETVSKKRGVVNLPFEWSVGGP